jgi:GT2 family glycosyltransferase
MLAIIPFYKKREQLDRCMRCLNASQHPVSPFVVDNNHVNVGFTKACNIGLREALRRGDRYALLLNQDCYVSPDTIGRLFAFMEGHPRCAIAGPKQLSAEDPDLIIHGGCTKAFPVGLHISGRVSLNDCCQSLPMPWINGACMIVRMEATREIGLMDEGYFLIGSDADYCFFARQRRWEVWYCAEAVALHESGGVSSVQPTLEALAHFNADQLYFRDKWIGSLAFECLQKTPPAPSAKLEEHEVDAALQKALECFHRNDLSQAEILARRVLDFEPGLPSAVLLLSRIQIELGAPALAARSLLRVLEKVPESAQMQLALADALFLSGFSVMSVPYYVRARALGLNSVELCNNLGSAFLADNKPQQAAKEWNFALKLDPANETAQKYLSALNRNFGAEPSLEC